MPSCRGAAFDASGRAWGEGAGALLRADAFAGQVLNAAVTQITPKGDATRKAYRVRLALPNDTPLMIGMTVEANIVLRETATAVLIPPAALRGDHVFIAQGEVARRVRCSARVAVPRGCPSKRDHTVADFRAARACGWRSWATGYPVGAAQ